MVDVRKPTGEVFRATVRHPGGITPPAAGAVVGVEFEARTAVTCWFTWHLHPWWRESRR